jgi:hypothetical protein
MQDFTFDDKTVEFTALTGEVVGSEKLSETHVSSSGGGGYVGAHGGHVSPPQIRSTSIINHEFWVRTDAGVERDVKLKGHDIPLRTGQRITLISATCKGGTSSRYSVLVNHSAQKQWFLSSGQLLGKFLGLAPFNWKAFLSAVALCTALGYVTGLQTTAFLLGGGYFVYRFYVDYKRHCAMVDQLNAHLKLLVQQAYQRENAREAV